MEFDIKIAMKYEVKHIVTDADTARLVHSGGLDVFASPRMFAMMEEAAFLCVEDSLGDYTTVGISLNSTHIAPTPVGMEVRVVAELAGIDGRKLVFDVKAYDEVEMIGECRHERFIIESEKFMKKLEGKRSK